MVVSRYFASDSPGSGSSAEMAGSALSEAPAVDSRSPVDAYFDSGNPPPRVRRRRERRLRSSRSRLLSRLRSSRLRSSRSRLPPRLDGAACTGGAAASTAASGAAVSTAATGAAGSSACGRRPRCSRPSRASRPSRPSRSRPSRSRPSRAPTGAVSYSSFSSEKSETYKNVSRSRPRSTNADCMPGSTRVTRPLCTLPASEYSFARWKYNSTNWSSSRIATFVSWRFEAITISFVIQFSASSGSFDWIAFGGRCEASSRIYHTPGDRNRRKHLRQADATVYPATLNLLPARTEENHLANIRAFEGEPFGISFAKASVLQDRFSLQIAGAGHYSQAPASKKSTRYWTRRRSSAVAECRSQASVPPPSRC